MNRRAILTELKNLRGLLGLYWAADNESEMSALYESIVAKIETMIEELERETGAR